jgi:predicted N-acetyltransferase YhbS
MSFRVIHLFESPEHLPLVAGWIYDEFWRDTPRHSPASLEQLLRQAKRRDAIPISLLAMRDDVPVGTVNLIENDDDSRPELTPWLAALFVAPQWRRQGVGSLLVQSAKQHARGMGIDALYLGTDNPKFYERFGATLHEETGGGLCVMRLDVA